jgi:hypothetical protein
VLRFTTPIIVPGTSLLTIQVAETESNEPILVARGYAELPEVLHPGIRLLGLDVAF